MIADYNSKPLQGQLFVEMRNVILGLKTEDFNLYKQLYLDVMKKYDLLDEAEKNQLHH